MVSLLIVYGLNIVKVYVNLFEFATYQLNIPDADPVIAFLSLLAIYSVIGAFTAYLGAFIGKKAQNMKVQENHFQGINTNTKEIFTLPSKNKFSLSLFIIHLLAIPAGLLIVIHTPLYLAGMFIFLYVFFVIAYYPGIFKRLKKPFFWFQLVLITVLSTFFWKIQANGLTYHPEGFQIGLGMTFRALLIVSGFSGISTELRNPVIKTFLLRKGFSNIYQAVSMAFNALPAMVGYMPKAKDFFKSPISSIANTILYAEYWYDNFAEQQVHFQREYARKQGA